MTTSTLNANIASNKEEQDNLSKSMEEIKKIRFSSCFSNLSLVETYVERMKEDYNIADNLYGNMLLAVVEAVTNAIEHGNCKCDQKDVEFSVYKNSQTIKFKIKDEGQGFDPALVPDPTHPDNIEEPSGRGVFLIKKLADLVVFSDQGSTVEIDFKI